MRDPKVENTIRRSLRRQLTTAVAVIGILVGGLGGIAAYAEISGAIIGAGTVIVAGRAKEVQHADGGSIGAITVREGDQVEAGQVLFELDGAAVRANLAIVTSQLHQLLAQESRLLAEQAGRKSIDFPEELQGGDARMELLRRGQVELMNARKATIDGRKSQLAEQIHQFKEKIAALRAEQQAIRDNLELLDDQIADLTQLHRKGLIADSQLVALKRERVTLVGSLSALESEATESQQAIGEREIQKIQLDEEFVETVLAELDGKRAEIAKLREERVAASDRLNRLEIRAPFAGYVHQLAVHTVGRVIAPGETLVRIIPADDDLIVEAKLNPTDVDQVQPGQEARIRLPGLDQRVTPQLRGEVLDVSPDLTTDPNTGMSFFTARVQLSEGEVGKLRDQKLRPGMPVEVFMETNMRSVLSYLAKPLQDQVQHAMREN